MVFRKDIQALRGIAILLVVAYHVRIPGFTGGFVGVDVFFVLSGFLITSILLQEFQSTGTISFLEFYSRRARRLLPAAFFVTASTIAIAAIALSPLEQRAMATSAFAAAAYASNIWFAATAADYLREPPDTNPFLHTWSLSVEEQFYLAWPLLLYLTAKRGGSRRALVPTMFAIVCALSFAAEIWMTNHNQPWAFFGSPTRAWQFGLGGLLASLPPSWMPAGRWRGPIASVGVLSILLAAVAYNNRTLFPGYAALLPTLGALLFISANTSESTSRWEHVFTCRPLEYLGGISYVWYLWHWPVLVLTQAIVPHHLGLGARIVCGLASLVLSSATRRMLEDRIRFSAYLRPRPAFTLLLVAAASLTITGTAVAWRFASDRASQTPEQRRFTLARSDHPATYSNGCHLDFREVSSPACEFGTIDGSGTIVLFGDSHAAQWFPALESVATAKQWELISLTKSGCPSADIVPLDAKLGRPYRECAVWRKGALARIEQFHPSLVIVANTGLYIDGIGRHDVTDVTMDLWTAALRRTLVELNDTGIRTVVLHESPLPGFDVPVCLARRSWWLGGLVTDCRFRRGDAGSASLLAGERNAVRDLKNVKIVDLSDTICPGLECEPTSKEMVIYSDDHHLTASFSLTLAPVLRRQLESIDWDSASAPDAWPVLSAISSEVRRP